jgi:hypothetical protein
MVNLVLLYALPLFSFVVIGHIEGLLIEVYH